ncbi:MAG: PKD domain-containing protein [Candidatus Aminicenantes bacterium]|nr:PKD domain-containing protein [Candidatus Aminicenantes bacterium]
MDERKRKPCLWLACLALFPGLAVPVFSQTVSDPFSQYDGRPLEGRLQNMTASRSFLVLHRVVGQGREVVESWEEGQLIVHWEKTFVSVGEPIVIDGFRVAFSAAETEPTANSVGLHIYDLRSGQRISYNRSMILGHAGRFLAISGDSILDMADGSVVFGPVSNVRQARFLATIGDKFLLMVSQAPNWNDRRPILYDPISKTDLWAGRALSAEMIEFLENRFYRATEHVYQGFPALLAEEVQSLFGPVFKFMLLKEDGQAVFLDRAFFDLSELKPYATVDFSYIWDSPNGRRLVAGINTRHLGRVDGEKTVIAVFDPAGAKLAQASIDPKTDRLAWTGLDPAGKLLAFINRHQPRSEDLIVSFALPSLARTELESAYNAQVNSPPGFIDGKLYFWDQERIYPPGVKAPARAKLWRTVVAALNPQTAGLMAYYPFDDSTWKLMSFARDRIRHVSNETHLFLPFMSADLTQNRSLILPIPRDQVNGWLNATFGISPEPVFTDADEAISYTPAGATVTANTGRLDGLKWRSPSHRDTTWFTLTLGGFSQMFEVPIQARPVNQPPVAKFTVPPRAENALWDVPVLLDAGSSSDPDGRVVSYAWNFDRSAASLLTGSPTISHEFAGGGAHEVMLTVTDDKGETGKITRIVNVPKTIDYGGAKRSGPVSVGSARTAGYEIEVTTGTEEGAGTNAWVYVSLYGSLNADGERVGTTEFALYDAISETKSDPFENGRTDVFKSHQGTAPGLPDSSSLDKIEFITIRHDNSGNRPDWRVKSVKIRNQANKMEWLFEPDVWLDWNKAPLNSVMGKFTPAAGDYPRGVLFGGAQRSWKMIEAGANVFILEPGAASFYFTSLDKADQIEIYRNGSIEGRQYGRGEGIATAPYIPKTEFGFEYPASKITNPTKFTVRISHPNQAIEETFVWVFPSGWKDYKSEALSAALIYPLKGTTSFFDYADSVIHFMSSVYTFEASLNAALSIVVDYGAKALGIFGGPGDSELKGTIEERVGIYVSKGLNGALKAMGLTLANSIFSETIGLFESMIKAREWAQQLGSVGSSAAAAAGGLQYLGRLAGCNLNLVSAKEMLRVIKAKLDEALTALDQNNPAVYRARMADIRMIAVGKNPDGILPADYLIDYGAYGIGDLNSNPGDNYCLSMTCILELNNIQRWKGGEIGPCFPTNVLIGWTDAEKIGETKSAMTTYEPLFRNIMVVAGVAISIALLK